MQFRGTPILVTLADGRLTLTAHREGVRRPVSVGVGDEVPRAAPRRPVHVRTSAGRACRASTGPRLTGGWVLGLPGSDLRCRRRACRLAACEGVVRVAARADGRGVERHRGRTTWSPEAFTPQVYQEEMSGKPRWSGARAALEYFHVPDDHDLRLAEYAARSRRWWCGSSRPGLHRVPRRAAVHHRRQARRAFWSRQRHPRERGTVPAQDPARHVRPGAGITSASLRPGLTLLDFFDADVWLHLAHGKPDPEMFLTAARNSASRRTPRSSSRTPPPASKPPARRHGRDRHRACRRRRANRLTRAGADIVVTTLDKVDHSALAAGRGYEERVAGLLRSPGCGSRRRRRFGFGPGRFCS